MLLGRQLSSCIWAIYPWWLDSSFKMFSGSEWWFWMCSLYHLNSVIIYIHYLNFKVYWNMALNCFTYVSNVFSWHPPLHYWDCHLYICAIQLELINEVLLCFCAVVHTLSLIFLITNIMWWRMTIFHYMWVLNICMTKILSVCLWWSLFLSYFTYILVLFNCILALFGWHWHNCLSALYQVFIYSRIRSIL